MAQFQTFQSCTRLLARSAQRRYHSARLTASCFQSQHSFPRPLPFLSTALSRQRTTPRRLLSQTSLLAQELTSQPDVGKNPEQDAAQREDRWADTPAYDLTFTCKQCMTRSTHRISKQGYHKGTVLISCPGCKNRHLMSDHLKIFSDKSVTLEDIMAEKGQMVKKGSLRLDDDVEIWDDGTVIKRETSRNSESKS